MLNCSCNCTFLLCSVLHTVQCCTVFTSLDLTSHHFTVQYVHFDPIDRTCSPSTLRRSLGWRARTYNSARFTPLRSHTDTVFFTYWTFKWSLLTYCLITCYVQYAITRIGIYCTVLALCTVFFFCLFSVHFCDDLLSWTPSNSPSISLWLSF